MMSPLMQPIEQIASSDILSCAPETPVYQAAAMMMESGCGSIVVFDAPGHALGIWTETDALSIDLTDPVARRQPISQVMSTQVVTLTHQLSVHDAVGHFRSNGIRHALVEGDWQTRHAFFRENLKLRAEVEELEHKSRRRDILVDDEALFSVLRDRRIAGAFVGIADAGVQREALGFAGIAQTRSRIKQAMISHCFDGRSTLGV
mgnify:CR=1 FL=1